MRRAIFSLVAVVLACLAVIPAAAHPRTVPARSALDRNGNKIFDRLDRAIAGKPSDTRLRVIAEFDATSSRAALTDARAAVGAFRVSYAYHTIPAFAARMTVGQIQALARRTSTVHIELDGRVHAMLDTARAAFGTDKAQTDFSVTGNNGSASSACPGERAYCKDDVTVAVIDTGIDAAHVDLNGGKVIGFVNCTSGTCVGAAPFDDNGHGSHVSSIIAGEGDGNASLHGVAPGASLVGIKVLNQNGSGFWSWVDAGLEWLIANRATYGIDELNMSLGADVSSDGTDSTSELTNRAAAAGVTPFIAAGNAGPGVGTVGRPASAEFAVTVGAMTDPQDTDGSYAPGFSLVYFSSRGPTADNRIKPDIAAPGVDIRAAQAGTGNGYVVYSGTSMATPFTAGVGALMLDANPALASTGTVCPPSDLTADCTDGVYDASMSELVKDKIMGTAVDWGPAGRDNEYGAGRLDGYAAVDAASSVVGPGGPVLPVHTFVQDSLPGAGSSDYYDVVVGDTSAPIAVTLIMSNWVSSTTPNFAIYLYNPAGSQVAQSSGTTRQETIGYRPTVTGTYRLRVYSSSGSGPYWFDLSAPPPPAPPGPPDAPVVSAAAKYGSSSEIDLSWGDVASETGYRVERSPDGVTPASWTVLATLSQNMTAYADTGLDPGATWYYKVVATNGAGATASAVASATTNMPPSAPTGLGAVVVSSTQINLDWDDATDPTLTTGYRVQRYGTSGWAQVGAPAVSAFSDTGLSQDTIYSYRVLATGPGGDSLPSDPPVSATTDPDSTPPTAPSGLTATNPPRRVNLKWNPSTDDGGSGLAGYKIWRSPAGANTFTQVGTTASTSFTDTLSNGLIRGHYYDYYVTAYDGAGNPSSDSNHVDAVKIR